MDVITYCAPDGGTISLTPGQVADLLQWGVWPRNASGEYCSVSHGVHTGIPTYTGQQLAAIILQLRDSTISEQVAAALGNDGTIFERDGATLEELCATQGVEPEYSARQYTDGRLGYVSGSRASYIAGDPVRFEFPDGSAIVISGDGWGVEGDTPFSWRM